MAKPPRLASRKRRVMAQEVQLVLIMADPCVSERLPFALAVSNRTKMLRVTSNQRPHASAPLKAFQTECLGKEQAESPERLLCRGVRGQNVPGLRSKEIWPAGSNNAWH